MSVYFKYLAIFTASIFIAGCGGGGGSGNQSADSPVNQPVAPTLPLISIEDATVIEGHYGLTEFEIIIGLDEPSSQEITVAYSVIDGTATAEEDYLIENGVYTFKKGEVSGVILAQVVGDIRYADDEGTEVFTIKLSEPRNANISRGVSTVTIDNDDLTEVESKHQARKLANNHAYNLGQEHEAGIVQLYADIDLDNDKDRDIVAFYSYDWNRVELPVTIYRNNRGAGFTKEITDIVTGSQGAVSVADFSGNGLEDIYFGDTGPDKSPFLGRQDQIIVQTPDGLLRKETQRLPQLIAYTHSVCVADFDNDGDVDIYAGVTGINGSGFDPSLRLLKNDGSGNFEDVSLDQWPSEIQDPEYPYRLFINSTVCGFLDRGDGSTKDLFLGGWNPPNSGATLIVANKHVVLKNNGYGFYEYDSATSLLDNPVFLNSSSNTAPSLHVEQIHFNGDTCEDALVYSSDYWDSHNRVVLFKSDCTGGFEEVSSWEFTTSGKWLAGVAARDVDSDGLMDFYGYAGSANQKDGVNSDKENGIYAFINQGDGSFVRRFLTIEEKESLPVIHFITMDFDLME